MKKGKTKSFTKLKFIEKKKYAKAPSTTNINCFNNYNDTYMKNQKELLRERGRFYTNNELNKLNNSNQKLKTLKNNKQNNDNSIDNNTIKQTKRRRGTYENQLILNDNTNIKNETINRINKNNLNNDKILLKIQKIQEKYEKKIFKDDIEIKNLLERNDKLEELVIKLKETLDHANTMFPDFLEQLLNTKEEKERESNRTVISNVDKKNEEEKLKEEINILKIKVEKYEEENNKLKYENIQMKNDFHSKIENIIQEIEFKQNKKEKMLNGKIKEMNNELNIKNMEYEKNQKQITKLISDNQQNLFQIKTLTKEIHEKDEENKILKLKINNNDKIINEKNEKKNDLLINDLKAELEEMIVENNDLKNNLEKVKQEIENKEKNIRNLLKIKENNENKINLIQNELEKKDKQLLNFKNNENFFDNEINDIKNENIKLKEDLENIINNKKEEINIIKDKINKELYAKKEENKKLNEIINDQEKIINELKDIVHKNNDKINLISKENNLLKVGIEKKSKEISDITIYNNTKNVKIKNELEELKKNNTQ